MYCVLPLASRIECVLLPPGRRSTAAAHGPRSFQASTTRESPTSVTIQFVRFADVFGDRLVAAFDSIPASRYEYRPTAVAADDRLHRPTSRRSELQFIANASAHPSISGPRGIYGGHS